MLTATYLLPFVTENEEEQLKDTLKIRTKIYFKSEFLCFRYGVRATTEECPLAVILMSLQSIFGVIIQVNYLALRIFNYLV